MPIWIYIPDTSTSFPQLKMAAIVSLPFAYQQGHYHKKVLPFSSSSSWIQIPELAHTNSEQNWQIFQGLLTWPSAVMFSYGKKEARPSQRIHIHTRHGKRLSKS